MLLLWYMLHVAREIPLTFLWPRHGGYHPSHRVCVKVDRTFPGKSTQLSQGLKGQWKL